MMGQWGGELGKRLTSSLKKEEYRYTRPRRGKIYEATILSIGEYDLVVDLGTKRDGIVPPKDLDLIDDQAYIESLNVGDRVPVVVLSPRGREGEVVVSLNKGLQQQDWLRAQDLMESEEVIEAEVVDANRGGVVVGFGRLRGFVPNSHIASIRRGVRGRSLREAKANLIGRTLSLVVKEVKQGRRRLVLSERVAELHKREQLLETLTPGEVRTGTVSGLTDFGAFVDLGGVDGLIHISELGWQHVNHPSDVLEVGDEVEVYVQDVDRERERVSLSRKRLLPDRWFQVTERLDKGDVVEGTVTSVADFGVFVDIGEGVEGLVHISEIAGNGAARPDLEVGSLVPVEVLNIDRWKHQIALGLPEAGAVPEGA
jgi:small subunit ribosomal protein S1